jgi:hypothetical protein
MKHEIKLMKYVATLEGEYEVTPQNCTCSDYRYFWEDAKYYVRVKPHDDRANTETIYVYTAKGRYLLARIPQSKYWGILGPE